MASQNTFLGDMDLAGCSDGLECMRNRSEIQFYTLAVLQDFFQLHLNSENDHFDFFIKPAKFIHLVQYTTYLIYSFTLNLFT